MALFCLAALWSFAEATLFFIAPDALLSIIALRSLGKAMIAALLASFAAAFGGLLVWTCAQHFPEETLQVLLLVPGISGSTFEMARQLLQAGLFEGLLGEPSAASLTRFFRLKRATPRSPHNRFFLSRRWRGYQGLSLSP